MSASFPSRSLRFAIVRLSLFVSGLTLPLRQTIHFAARRIRLVWCGTRARDIPGGDHTAHPEVKVLVVSTYSDPNLVEGCLREGARGYVIKDIEGFNLKQSIRAVHRGETVLSPSIAGLIVDRIRTEDGHSARYGLNPSQIRILRLIGQGLSNREIAVQVHLSENTVKSHVQEIFQKLGVRNRVEAALKTTREGLI